MIEGERY